MRMRAEKVLGSVCGNIVKIKKMSFRWGFQNMIGFICRF